MSFCATPRTPRVFYMRLPRRRVAVRGRMYFPRIYGAGNRPGGPLRGAVRARGGEEEVQQFGHESQVGGLAPHQQVERDVVQLLRCVRRRPRRRAVVLRQLRVELTVRRGEVSLELLYPPLYSGLS